MNIYFLVEGRHSEKKVYPKWLSFLIPELSEVKWANEVQKNNYYIFTGKGYPALLDAHLRHCVADIHDIGKYNYLVICLDADEETVQNRRQEVLHFMNEEKITLPPKTKFEIIVQDKCLETWFLGNPKVFKRNPENSFLQKCVAYYDVQKNDPELMEKFSDFEESVSIFHASYLKKLLAERNVRYTKVHPRGVIERYYLEQLLERSEQTRHLASFQYFVDFCAEIRQQM